MLPLIREHPLTTANKKGTARLTLPAKPALVPVPNPPRGPFGPGPAVLPGMAAMPALQVRVAVLYSSHTGHRRSRSSTHTEGTDGGKGRLYRTWPARFGSGSESPHQSAAKPYKEWAWVGNRTQSGVKPDIMPLL